MNGDGTIIKIQTETFPLFDILSNVLPRQKTTARTVRCAPPFD
jgi:hypothetical protein